MEVRGFMAGTFNLLVKTFNPLIPGGNKKVTHTYAGTNDITNNTKSFENYKKITDTIKSKLPNCKYAISNVVMRKDKPDIEKKVIEFNSRLSKFCSKNKIDIIENENLDGSCLSFKKLHLNKKGNSYLANNFLDFLHSF